MSDKEILFVDTETYANVAFLGARTESGKEFRYWIRYAGENKEEIKDLVHGPYIFVTFNGLYFDLPIIGAMYAGKSPETIKHVANSLINQGVKPWQVTRPYELAYKKVKTVSHIDLIRVAPQPTVGLKMYGARLSAPSIIENPYHHEDKITPEMEAEVENYCVNGDLTLTEILFKDLIKPIELRVDMSRIYGSDMRCKTDSQMAEAIFVKRLGLSKNRETYIPEYVTYTPPEYIKFKDPAKQELIQKIKEHQFTVNPGHGHVILPAFLNLPVLSTTGQYKMGIGGLHSKHDKKQCWIAGDGWVIEDIDGTSFYPTIILKSGLIPHNLGPQFLDEYRTIYERRLEAKRLKDQSSMDTLRIALNGTFGKLMDMFSPLYSPDLGLYIVLTGQLILLQVIELLEEVGVKIISANTDGIILWYRKEITPFVRKILDDFTKNTGYPFESTLYRCVALKDVNNYFAVKMDRTLKTKGLYAKQDIRKNPGAGICNIAVGKWLAHGTSVEETVRAGKLKDFLYARNVNKEGGGMYGENYLGKVVRWYKCNDPNPLNFTYRAGGAKIARTDNSCALQAFDPDGPLPANLDYEAYTKEAIRIIQDVGAAKYLTPEEQLLLPIPKRRKKKDGQSST